MTREDLLKKINEKFKEYDYELLNEESCFNGKSILILKCKKHGIFNKNLGEFIYRKNKQSLCRKCSDEIKSMKNRLNLNSFKKLLFEKHKNRFEIVEYNGMRNNAIFFDKKYNKKVVIIPQNILRNNYNGFEESNKNKRTAALNNFLKNMNEKNISCKNLDEYIGSDVPINFICEKGHIFKVRPRSIINEGTGCPECSRILMSRNKNDFISISDDIHLSKYNYSKVIYINNLTKVEIICPIHGSFFQRPKQHIRGEGCPSCCESKGERRIYYFLKKNRIKHIRQKKFDDCINALTNSKLIFDFYLPEKNLLIEYDGQQHCIDKTSGFYTKDKIERIIERDEVKNKYALKKGIKLLRISYKDFEKIEEILGFEII